MQHAKNKQPSYALPSSISSINSIFLDEEVKRQEKKKEFKNCTIKHKTNISETNKQKR